MTGMSEPVSSDLSKAVQPKTSTDSALQSKPNVEATVNLKTFLRKDAFVKPDADLFEEIVSFIGNRLQANGETLYQLGLGENGDIGLTEDELLRSTATLSKVCARLGADYLQLNSSLNATDSQNADQRHSALFLIRGKAESDDFQEVRVSVLGNVDAGKSTLLSVLTHGQLDDGRGLARQKLFRHKHEIESGRTSSVGSNILGFDSKGNIVNQTSSHSNSLNWAQISERSSKVISFIDLCGHERYLKTTVFGMTSLDPDYTMMIVGGNAGIIGSSKEHLGLSLALKIPLFVVVTKIDSTPPNVLENTMKVLLKILKSSGCRKSPLVIQSQADVLLAASNFSASKLCPIFPVSCVTGTNLELLKSFLNLLSSKHESGLDNEPAEFQIDETYSVAVGTVVSGLCLKGVIRTNDVLYLGPNKISKFDPVAIKSIHRKRMPVVEVRSGQTASFALKKVKRNEVRKGMVLLAPCLEPKAYFDFYAEILILHHPTTISCNYQAMVHCGSVRQTATIVSIRNQDCLRTGDKAIVHLRFIKHPEYIRPDQNMVFREGRTKAIGKVLSVITETAAPASLPISGSSKLANKKMKRLLFAKQQLEANENDPSNKEINRNKTTKVRTKS